MSKETKAAEAAQEQTTAVATVNEYSHEQLMQLADGLTTIENSSEIFETVTNDWFKFEQGEVNTLVILAVVDGENKKREVVPEGAVQVLDKHGRVWRISDAVVLKSVRERNADKFRYPFAAQIVFKGKKEGKENTYNDFDIAFLPSKNA